jgi:hypothetical protein
MIVHFGIGESVAGDAVSHRNFWAKFRASRSACLPTAHEEMSSLVGKLCLVCVETFRREIKPGPNEEAQYHRHHGNNSQPFDRIHHQDLESVTRSKNDGCFICSWLWAKIPPYHPAETSLNSPHSVRTLCRLSHARGIHADFCIAGWWGADMELHGTLFQGSKA